MTGTRIRGYGRTDPEGQEESRGGTMAARRTRGEKKRESFGGERGPRNSRDREKVAGCRLGTDSGPRA